MVLTSLINSKFWLKKKNLRAYALNKKCKLVSKNPSLKWIFDCPYDVRDGAVDEFITSLKTNLSKSKKKKGFIFKMKFNLLIINLIQIIKLIIYLHSPI